jgi:glutathione S-transferase
MPMFYAHRLLPESAKTDGTLAAFGGRVMRKVMGDLDWLEGELELQKTKISEGDELFLVGKHLTGADVMMGFSVGMLLQRAVTLHQPGKQYKAIEEWIGGLTGRKAYKKAAQRLEFKG